MSKGQGHEAVYLDRTIEFLSMSSNLIETFSDTRPVSSLDDHRLATNQEVLDYLNKWEMDAQSHTELSKSEIARRILSDKLRFDISSMVTDFHEVCNIALERFPGSTISLFRIQNQQ